MIVLAKRSTSIWWTCFAPLFFMLVGGDEIFDSFFVTLVGWLRPFASGFNEKISPLHHVQPPMRRGKVSFRMRSGLFIRIIKAGPQLKASCGRFQTGKKHIRHWWTDSRCAHLSKFSVSCETPFGKLVFSCTAVQKKDLKTYSNRELRTACLVISMRWRLAERLQITI